MQGSKEEGELAQRISLTVVLVFALLFLFPLRTFPQIRQDIVKISIY